MWSNTGEIGHLAMTLFIRSSLLMLFWELHYMRNIFNVTHFLLVGKIPYFTIISIFLVNFKFKISVFLVHRIRRDFSMMESSRYVTCAIDY